jgi:hypothetical protein
VCVSMLAHRATDTWRDSVTNALKPSVPILTRFDESRCQTLAHPGYPEGTRPCGNVQRDTPSNAVVLAIPLKLRVHHEASPPPAKGESAMKQKPLQRSVRQET